MLNDLRSADYSDGLLALGVSLPRSPRKETPLCIYARNGYTDNTSGNRSAAYKTRAMCLPATSRTHTLLLPLIQMAVMIDLHENAMVNQEALLVRQSQDADMLALVARQSS